MKPMTLSPAVASLAVMFALSTPMAWAKSKHHTPHHISRVQTYSNLEWMGGFNQGWLGPGQGIGGAGATPGPGGGNTVVTTGHQAFGSNGSPDGPALNISGTGPSTSGGGSSGGGGAGGGGGGMR
jgi:hypothetical protein